MYASIFVASFVLCSPSVLWREITAAGLFGCSRRCVSASKTTDDDDDEKNDLVVEARKKKINSFSDGYAARNMGGKAIKQQRSVVL